MEFNKYQQGGAMGQQNLEQQVTQLVQAAVAGDQKATQQIEQIMKAAQQGNQDAIQIAQVIQKVVQGLKAKQGIRARLGAKLDYINKLKGNCPDGFEPYYFKNGGSAIKKGCRCKLSGGGNTPVENSKTKKMNEVDKFKAKRPTKYDGKKHERLAELNAYKKASPAQKDSLQTYQELYKKLPNNVKSKKYNDQTVDEKKCGGKAKKNK